MAAPFIPNGARQIRTDFSGVTSLRQLTSEEWTQLRQADPKKYAQLENELNGTGSPTPTPDGSPRPSPAVFEKSVNGYVQPQEQNKVRRFVNGILQD